MVGKFFDWSLACVRLAGGECRHAAGVVHPQFSAFDLTGLGSTDGG